MIIYLFLCVFVGTYHSMHAEVREQLEGVGSFLLPCVTQGLNSGSQAWGQNLLTTHPPHQLYFDFLRQGFILAQDGFELMESSHARNI